MTAWDECSFLAEPGRVSDWRMVVLVEAAVDAGLFAHLPATTAALADRLDLDEQAVRVVLEALACWAVVKVDHDGRWTPGPDAPSPDAIAVLGHHARAIRLWSKSLDDRLRGLPPSDPRPGPETVDRMLDALTVNGRESAPGAVDACLDHVPEARRVLDLGGGHGEYALELARRGLETTMQDQEHVIDAARARGRLAGGGVGLFGGSFFEALPDEPFDLVLCAGVTYTFDAASNTELYRRIRSVLAPGGTLAVHTFLRGTDPVAAVFAVQMLSGGRGGDTHGEDDHRRWLAAAGYGDVTTVRLARRPEWLIFARP